VQQGQFNAIGVELGQRYQSDAVVGDGTPFPAYDKDPDLYYHPTTHPGAYLPHVWLEKDGKRVSTIDLPGADSFCLITGTGGQDWLAAVDQIAKEFGVRLKGVSVGMRQQYDDVLGEWTRRREVGDHGCLLVRPDRYIAWRSASRVSDPVGELRAVFKQILREAA
jgi:2,4-dichlorophenol 6-monooxygenase